MTNDKIKCENVRYSHIIIGADMNWYGIFRMKF